MASRYAVILCVALAGCATQHRPDYQAVTEFYPDCANRDAQIRYMYKLQKFPTNSDNTELYNRTLRVQMERLAHYCQ